jgi:HEAT repeats
VQGAIMEEVLDQLGQIFENLGKEGVSPAILDGDFQELVSRLPFTLPGKLEELYRWHDGIKDMIPAYDFLSFSDAVIQYEELIAFGKDEQDEDFFSERCFPIFQFEGSYFFIDCNQNISDAIYEFSYESEGVKQYESLQQMIQIIADAYLSRAYYIADDLTLENPVLLQKITDKYSSEESRNLRELEWNKLCSEINALKNAELFQELSSEEIEQQELSALLGLATPRNLYKESLIRRLCYTYDERAITFLVEFLSDENPVIIAKAAYGLGELKAREHLPELVKLTRHNADAVRNLATHAIKEIISPDDQLILEPLLQLLSDDSALVRIAATQALGQLRSPIAVEPVIALLGDKSSGVRIHAIETLGKIGDVRAIEVLQQGSRRVLPMEAQTIERAIRSIEKANS